MVDAVAEEGDFLQAIERYTEAISLNRNNHLLFYNRSAAYARVGKFAEALEDAKRCHELKPDWPKVTIVHVSRGVSV
jgi:stress-induced-phosphoprotein 1